MRRHGAGLTAIIVMLAACLLWSLALVGAGSAQPAATPQDFPSDSAVLALIKQRVDLGGTVGIVVGLLERDGRRRIIAYGDPGPGQPPLDGNSVFDIGSITKVFTAILLAEMVLDGEVNLDDPVQKFLPSSVRVPQRNGRQITLAHLAMHNSGLPRDPANVGPDPGPNSYAQFTVERMYGFLSGYSLPRDPGAGQEYSNVGVGLLGHALSLAAGEPFEQLEQERVWTPLGLHHTGITMTPWMRAHLAIGHASSGGATVPNWNSPAIASAGAMRSTANDLLDFLWASIHADSSPLGRAMAFTQRSHLAPGASAARPLIWGRRSTATDTIFGHTGGTGGYRTRIGFLRLRGVGAVVLTNSGNASSDDLVPHLLDSSIPLNKPVRRLTWAPAFALLGLAFVLAAVILFRRHGRR